MSYRDTWTPCDEERSCKHNNYRHGGFRGCMILNANKDGSAPYKSGKCPFYKSNEERKE